MPGHSDALSVLSEVLVPEPSIGKMGAKTKEMGAKTKEMGDETKEMGAETKEMGAETKDCTLGPPFFLTFYLFYPFPDRGEAHFFISDVDL